MKHIVTLLLAVLMMLGACALADERADMLLAAAIERYLPEAKPDFVRCRRLEMLDEQGEVFR